MGHLHQQTWGLWLYFFSCQNLCHKSKNINSCWYGSLCVIHLLIIYNCAADDYCDTCKTCPSGWTQFKDHCYLYQAAPLDWADAEVLCGKIWVITAKLFSWHVLNQLVLMWSFKSFHLSMIFPHFHCFFTSHFDFLIRLPALPSVGIWRRSLMTNPYTTLSERWYSQQVTKIAKLG